MGEGRLETVTKGTLDFHPKGIKEIGWNRVVIGAQCKAKKKIQLVQMLMTKTQ